MFRINHIKRNSTLLFVLIGSLVLFNNGIARGGNTKFSGRRVSSKALRSMARVYMAYGKYEKAQPLVEQALASARKTNISDYELAMCLIDTACLYKHQNKLSDAEQMCEQGLELQQKVLDEEHLYIAYTLRILSSIYREQGKLHEAKSALEKATAIIRSCDSEDNYTMVALEMESAKLFVMQGNLEEAESHYSHVLSIINKYSPDHLYKASVLEDMAELYLLQGKYTEAEPLINQVISMKGKVYGPEHHFLAPALFIKASIEREKGNYTTSEKFIHRALETVKTTENITKIVESQQRAEAIRANKFVDNKLVAKADNRDLITTAVD
ncbi:MAG: tetratricopeptide repeat protein [Planctomycetota bacterium]